MRRCSNRVLAVLELAVLMVAAGCSAATTPPNESSSPLPTKSVATSSTSSTVVVSGGLVPAEDPWALAEEYHLVSPDGEYVGPIDTNGDPLLLEPIEGYRDFSSVDPFEIDAYEVNRLWAGCVNDHGFPAQLKPDGLTIDYTGVTDEQQQIAQAVSIACFNGLRLPNTWPPQYTNQQWEKLYSYELALADCVRGQGYDVTDPPSVDVFIDTTGMWSPYDELSLMGAVQTQLKQACPPSPVGGFAAWDPGDPILPEP